VKVMQGQLDQRVLLTLNVRSACNRFT
jgi:hypothetical protein